MLGQDDLELADVRHLVDYQLVPHRHRQLEDLPQAVGGAGEDGQPPGVGPVDPLLHALLDPGQVACRRHAVASVAALLGVTDEGVEAELVLLRPDVAPPVHVQVQRDDRCVVATKCDQRPDHVLGQRVHGTLHGEILGASHRTPTEATFLPRSCSSFLESNTLNLPA